MKKLLILILLAAAGYFAYQKFVVGEQSEETKMVRALADELSAIKKQSGEAGRTAGISGMDMTSSVDSDMRQAEALLEKLRELKNSLTEEKALQKADELEAEIQAFLKRE